MTFWQDTSLMTILIVGLLLGVSKIVQNNPFLNLKNIPFSIVAGLLGFALQNMGWLTMDQHAMERIVYHGLAITFIAIGLQKTPQEAQNKDAIAMGLGFSIMAVLQGFVAILCLAILSLFDSVQHPGLGLLLPLGLNQGPGQALSMGNAWEATGLQDGGQMGLILAASGFLWAIVCGIPLAIYGQKKGWIQLPSNDQDKKEHLEQSKPSSDFNTHCIAIAVIYVCTFGMLYGLDQYVLAEKPKLMSMLWGFHFLIALLLSLSTRTLWSKIHFDLSNKALTEITNTTVDFVTCTALIAVQVSILTANLFMISLLSILGLLVTFFGTLYLSQRGFGKDRFAHALLWFGASTGTLPMGIALLRIADPQLQSTATTSATKGAAFALIFSAPLLLFVMPYAITQWPDNYPTTYYTLIGILIVYMGFIVFCWKKMANLGVYSSFLDKNGSEINT